MKRASSPTTTARVRVQPKRARVHTPPRTSLHSWLKPGEPAPLLVSSPALNAVTSTFVSFSLALSVPPHVRTAEALKAHVKRVVRELDVVSLVGRELVDSKEGAFQNDGGLALGNRRRAREPDHRMWACRALALKEGRDGTAGEDDFQVRSARPGCRFARAALGHALAGTGKRKRTHADNFSCSRRSRTMGKSMAATACSRC